MKPQSAKQKGRELCKRVKDLLLIWYQEAHTDDIKVTSSGAGGEDLQFSKAMRDLLPVSIECKARQKLNIWDAYAQAEANAGPHIPMVAFKRNRGEILCALKMEDFLKLVSRRGPRG